MGGDKRGELELTATQPLYASIAGGRNNKALHTGSVLIGSGLTSDHDYQLKVGTADSNQSITLTKEQWLAVRDAMCPGAPNV